MPNDEQQDHIMKLLQALWGEASIGHYDKKQWGEFLTELQEYFDQVNRKYGNTKGA